MNSKFSFGGQLYESTERKFLETILLTPFYGAHRAQLQRHIQFLNKIGFSVVTYNLNDKLSLNAFSAEGKFGFKHIWADQVEKILSEIPGDKIVYGLSNVAAGAIEAIGRRKASDVSALVCDSGPSGKFAISAWNLIGNQLGEKSLTRRAFKTVVGRLFWSLDGDPLNHDLNLFPEQFPVLSIAGGHDVLISVDQVDAAFIHHSQIALQKLFLPDVGHLEGLKKATDLYQDTVTSFLSAHAIPVST